MRKKEGNKFDISMGNLITLKMLIEMMTEEKWRNKLRRLALEYHLRYKGLEKDID